MRIPNNVNMTIHLHPFLKYASHVGKICIEDWSHFHQDGKVGRYWFEFAAEAYADIDADMRSWEVCGFCVTDSGTLYIDCNADWYKD